MIQTFSGAQHLAAAQTVQTIEAVQEQSEDKSKSEDIEYVPTQVFTEYIRHRYEDIEGNPIGGILYPSSRNPGGISCVLFIMNEQCVDKHSIKKKTPEKISENAYLFLEKVERRSPYKK